jgi:integrase
MSRALHRLSARQVVTLKAVGRHADGGGLYLRITAGGARSWVFMAIREGRRSEIGLGSSSAVSLASARRIASEMREAVAAGTDPRLVISRSDANESEELPTFGNFAESYIASVEAGWRNAVHRQQWRHSLRDHARLLRDKPIDQIGTDDVLAVLQPIWLTRSETAKRVRGRIEKILDAAKARGLRPRDSMNPAAWRGHLSLLLPAPSKLTRGHHAALPWSEAPAFMAELRKRQAVAARCLEFVILTAARSGEALGTTWSEIDLGAKLWTVPAKRMKAGAEHVVPLPDAAVELLEQLRQGQPSPASLVFSVAGAARSNMAMAMLLRRMGRSDITTHGFRSTFRDWAGDATNYPRELVEQALAHSISNKAERAYRRGTAVERRRELMESWAEYLHSPPGTDNRG